MNNITAYPLCWPVGQRRTPTHRQGRAPFKMQGDKAQREMVKEIALLGGTNLVISSDVPVRKDGLPYADAARRVIRDPGVAVYFDYKGSPMCFACDKWDVPMDNIRAIGKTIEAIRGIERWGSGDMMERAFTGYTALPAPLKPQRHWRTVLGVSDAPRPVNPEFLKERYNALAKKHHPDHGGSQDAMAELNHAYDQAKKEMGT